MRGRSRWWLSLLALAASAAAGQVSPNGGEFQVNSYTTSEQSNAAVAAAADGTVLITWNSWGSSGNDQDGYSIQGQRLDAAGSPLGNEFQVNTYTYWAQWRPGVAIGPTGHAIVAWWSSGEGPDEFDVHAQRFDPNGAALGGEFQVNTTPLPYGFYWSEPDASHDPAGNFVVVWTINIADVRGRRFDIDGQPTSGEFQVNSASGANEYHPSVASDGAGNFVVAWDSYWIPGDIQARRFEANGAPIGDQFQVETYTTGHHLDPSVAVDAAGNFVIAWATIEPGPVLGDIRARRFDAAGVPVGSEFEVNTLWPGFYPEVDSDRAGNFVVVWASEGSDGSDTAGLSVQARQFRPDGSPLGPPSQVNTYTTGDQWLPDIALDGAGNFVVTWTSEGSSGTDTSDTSIQARRFDGLFRDGFETGGTARWTLTVP